jgi:hypothetical protein
MIIFGYTPKDIKEKIKLNKWLIVSYVAVFILGAVIF